MIVIEKAEAFNFEGALRGARNPMNSWDRSDSRYDENKGFILGENDLDLAKRLCTAGSDHRKFLRQIFVSTDIFAPLYWWKEFDTYKVGTVANSTSTMHKIHSKAFAIDDFSHDKMTPDSEEQLLKLVEYLETIRKKYIKTKEKAYWYDLIQLLPSSYNQLRTCTLNYEVLVNIYYARKNHKLDEWHAFCGWIETLPYASDLITFK